MKVAAVFVLFHPDQSLEKHISAVFDEIDQLYLYRNSTITAARAEALENAFGHKLCWLGNGKNAGIAKALNRGLIEARRAGCTWLVTMDQDTYIETCVFRQLKQRAARKDELCLLFTPNLMINHQPAYADQQATHWVMSSANFVRTDSADLVGAYNQDYFIDGVDIEFCLRLDAAGYHFEVEQDLQVEHSLGRQLKTRLLGKDLTISEFQPVRKYYIFRNYLDIIWRKPAGIREKLALLGILFYRLKLALFIEPDKAASLRMILKGILHGLSANLGKLDRQ